LYDNPYLFTGRRVDILDNGSVKLQYNRNRYYDQYTGRWLTHDPEEYVDGLSLYEYVRSNPCGGLDPEGLRTWRTWDHCLALKALEDQIAEWRRKEYNFAADLMEYFASMGGPYDYVPTAANIEEVKEHGKGRILDVIYRETLSMQARRSTRGVPIGTMWDVSITHPGRGSGASSNIRWWPHKDNKNMLYAYGGADLNASGKVYIFDERDRWRIPWQWSGRVDIHLGDDYTFDVGPLKENLTAGWSPAYDAALWLQLNCGYQSFYHQMEFDLRWDWLDPPDAARDDYPRGIY